MSNSSAQLLSSSTPGSRTVHPTQIALDFGGFFRNKFVNPDFVVATNGTSYSTPLNGAGVLDGYLVSYDGTIGSFTISQQSHTIGQTTVPDEPQFFMRWNHTSAGSGSSFRRLEQRVSGVRTLAGKTATFTLYMKADSARNVTLDLVQSFGSGGSADVVTSGGTLALTTSFQKFEVSVTVPSISGKTIGTGNYLALRLGLPINTSMTIDFSHFQLEENGSTAFEQRPLFLEQILCLGGGTVSSVDASGGVETVAGVPVTGTGTIRSSQLVNSQTGTTYIYLTGDRAKLVSHSNASAIAGTLPQASASFPSGWFTEVQNVGVGTLTITPTTSTIDGASSLALTTGQGVKIFSDGTNYFTNRGGAGLVIPSEFTTGDVKLTLKTAADSGWVLMNDGSIGDASSSATTRANADTSTLFALLWNNTADAECPVSGGRGANAAADFAAHKRITLPLTLGRSLACYGAGSGLTSRVLGKTTGEETHVLDTTEIPAHTHNIGGSTGVGSTSIAGGNNIALTQFATSSTGGGLAHNNMQPTTFLNVMIKL